MKDIFSYIKFPSKFRDRQDFLKCIAATRSLGGSKLHRNQALLGDRTDWVFFALSFSFGAIAALDQLFAAPTTWTTNPWSRGPEAQRCPRPVHQNALRPDVLIESLEHLVES